MKAGCALLVVLVFTGSSAYGQELKIADLPEMRRIPVRQILAAWPQDPVAQPAPPRKLARKKPAMILMGIAIAATILDVEATQHCIAIGTCYEANLFMPYGRWGQYGIKGGVIFSTTLYGISLRRLPEGNFMRKLWWIPQAANIGGSLYGFSTGLKYR